MLGISENNITNTIHDSSSKFDQPLLADTLTKGVRPKSYRTDLAPQPSNLQPHCLARDRLQLWCPSSSRSNTIGNVVVSDLDLERILDMINISWAKGTREVYGAGPLVYHVFCNSCDISEDNRGLASPLRSSQAAQEHMWEAR